MRLLGQVPCVRHVTRGDEGASVTGRVTLVTSGQREQCDILVMRLDWSHPGTCPALEANKRSGDLEERTVLMML